MNIRPTVQQTWKPRIECDKKSVFEFRPLDAQKNQHQTWPLSHVEARRAAEKAAIQWKLANSQTLKRQCNKTKKHYHCSPSELAAAKREAWEKCLIRRAWTCHPCRQVIHRCQNTKDKSNWYNVICTLLLYTISYSHHQIRFHSRNYKNCSSRSADFSSKRLTIKKRSKDRSENTKGEASTTWMNHYQCVNSKKFAWVLSEW